MAIAPGSKDVGGVIVARWRVPLLADPAPPADEPPPHAARVSNEVATAVATSDLRMCTPGSSGPAGVLGGRSRRGKREGSSGRSVRERDCAFCGAGHALHPRL